MSTRQDADQKEALDHLFDENTFLRLALEKTDQGKELIRQREEFSLLLTVSKLIVSELSLDKVFRLVADKARDLVHADMVLVPMLNEQRDRYTYRAASGADAGSVLDANFPVTAGMCGWVLKNERSLLFGESSPSWLDETTTWEKGQQSAVLVPLFGRKQIIGGLSALGKHGGGSFTVHDLDLLTMFANQVSTAIENATLFQKLEIEMEERRQAEIIVRESEQSYKTLAENLPGLVYRVFLQENNRAIFFNGLSESMTGYGEHELECGEVCPLFSVIAPGDRAVVVDEIRRALEESRPFSVEYRLEHKNGALLYISEQGSTISGGDGRPLYIDGVIFDITERKRSEEHVVSALREKEVLLREIHHRVKNNMQVIYSLLSLQSRCITDQSVLDMFNECQNRVRTMALIHEKLYGSADLAHIEFKQYLQTLIADLADSYRCQEVVLSVDMGPITIDVNVGIPCGLIVNELVSNSLKYAFPGGRKGTITVGINKDHNGNNVLTIADDGIGLPDTMDFRNTSSLGLQLVNVLTKQLGGTIELSREGGTRFRIVFPG